MSAAYSLRLRSLAKQEAKSQNIAIKEGVYLATPGPSYESPAEIRAFRALGADLVGMSTVPEVITARHAGIEVLGISCATNLAAGVDPEATLSHAEVIATTKRVGDVMRRLLVGIVGRL
jgi:purine-nucleoside phosphorylase